MCEHIRMGKADIRGETRATKGAVVTDRRKERERKARKARKVAKEKAVARANPDATIASSMGTSRPTAQTPGWTEPTVVVLVVVAEVVEEPPEKELLHQVRERKRDDRTRVRERSTLPTEGRRDENETEKRK